MLELLAAKAVAPLHTAAALVAWPLGQLFLLSELTVGSATAGRHTGGLLHPPHFPPPPPRSPNRTT